MAILGYVKICCRTVNISPPCLIRHMAPDLYVIEVYLLWKSFLMQIAGGSSVLPLHFYLMKTQWSLLLHDNSKVCLYVWIESCVIGVMRYVNMHGSKPLKKERLIFCHGFAYILVVYVLICPSFLSFFRLPGGEKQSAFVTVQPMQKK